MATYRQGTLCFMEALGDKLLELSEDITLENGKKVKRIILKGEDFERILPNKRDLAQKVLSKTGHIKKASELKYLAERTGKHQTLLNQIIKEDTPNQATREMILCAVLLRDQVPCAEEVDHILLTMQREALYTNCFTRMTNCRNYLIRQCLDYANAGYPCPTADWLVFTNSVICYFTKDVPMAALDAWEPDFSFIEKPPYRQLLKKWEQQLQQIRACYLNEYRDALINAYRTQNPHLKTRADIQNEISKKVQYDTTYARSVFSETGRKAGSREMLIKAAKGLGCNLKETNLLLRQADKAPLYPFRGVGGEQDTLDVQILLQNPGLLAPEELEQFLSKGVY